MKEPIENLRTSFARLSQEVEKRQQVQAELDQVMVESEKQRRLYDTILSNTPDLVYVFDLNHRFTYANKALLAMWGRTWDEAIGKNCLELGYPEWHAAMHDREIEQVVKTKEPIRGDVPFTGANGLGIYDYIFVPVIGEDGEVEAVAGTTRDVTKRRHVEDALQHRTEQFETLLRNSPLAIYLIDSDFVIREANATATRELKSDTDLVGRNLNEVLRSQWPAVVIDEVERIFRHTLETGEPYVNSEWVNPRDGQEKPDIYEWQIHRITLPDGTYGVVCYFRDISAMIDARDKAMAANAAKSRFLACMSHELRTPLNAIIGYGEMLKDELTDINQLQMATDMDKILLSGKHLLAVISDILDLSKIEAGKIDLEFKWFNVREALNEAISMVVPLIDKNQNVIKLEDTIPGSLMIRSDVTRFRQIVFNLLSNAGKFTHKGEIRIDCRTVSGEEQEEWVELAVSDTGCGMSPDKIQCLFTDFTRLDTDGPTMEGAGLGLAINKRLCLLMGGEITVSSEPNSGSVFTVRLPAGGDSKA